MTFKELSKLTRAYRNLTTMFDDADRAGDKGLGDMLANEGYFLAKQIEAAMLAIDEGE
jgi:hypothetical protein